MTEECVIGLYQSTNFLILCLYTMAFQSNTGNTIVLKTNNVQFQHLYKCIRKPDKFYLLSFIPSGARNPDGDSCLVGAMKCTTFVNRINDGT